jgi:Protein kinase domain
LGLCTLTARVLRGQSYALAHVGDTRAYLLRDAKLTQLTQDHVAQHPDFSHQLLRAVGLEERLVVDYSQGDVQVGDLFVLLSDGVHGKLSGKKLKQLLQDERKRGSEGEQAPREAPSCQSLSTTLVQAALAAGSDDNATALVVRVRGLLATTLADEKRHAQALPIPSRLKVGDHIDGMVVTAPVADNGINILYQVRDPATQKLYALKTLNPQRAHDAEERAMLAHEAWLAKHMMTGRAAAYLVHVHEALPTGLAPSCFYVLYDWHSGETLQQMLERKHSFSVPQAITAATHVAKALGRLHRQSVLHRDIKPANLHQGDDGVLRVLDLGVALSGREPEATRLLHAGTPSYINPEQWGLHVKANVGTADKDGPQEKPDAQSDLFALGVTLYQLLTGGKLPYGDVLPYQMGRYFRDPTAPSRHNPGVPIWLDHVALKAVARDKRLRFETAEEFVLALERGASRPLTAPAPTPLIQRDPTAIWKMALGLSVLFNVLLVYWVLFLPK